MGVNVTALMQEMTLEEKCAQLGSAWFTMLLVDGDLDDVLIQAAIGLGRSR